MLNSENINNLVIIDFGRSEHITNKLRKGTRLYNAPELNNKYNKVELMNASFGRDNYSLMLSIAAIEIGE